MPQENLATLRETEKSQTQESQKESGPGADLESAGQEISNEISQEKGQVEELGRALPDDPEAKASTQATVIELDKISQRYSAQLNSIANPDRPMATLRKPAEVIDLEMAKTLRAQRASLRLGYKTREQEEAEIDKAFAELMPEELKKTESLRSERLRKRMEHQVPPTMRVVTLPENKTGQSWKPEPVSQEPTSSEQELPLFIPEASPMAQSVREPVTAVPQRKETLKSADIQERIPTIREHVENIGENELVTLREEAPPTIRDEGEEEPSTLRDEDESALEEVQEIPVDEDNEAVLHATIEGLKELSGDEWSDLYKADLPWTEEVWSKLENEAPPGGVSQREELRQLAMNKAEIGLSLAANAIALKELHDMDIDVPEGHNIFLQKRKLEEALAQDIAKEKKLYQEAHGNEDTVDVDISELKPEKPKPVPRYSDDELEVLAKIKPAEKPGIIGRTASAAWGGTKYAGYGVLALGLAGAARIAWSLLSGETAHKVLDWIDKGLAKVQKYAFANDPVSALSSMIKDTGDAIHKKMDESIAKGEKKKEE